MRPAATLDQARAEMRILAERIEHDHPRDYSRLSFPTASLREAMTGEVKPALLAMFGGVAALLLIAVVNIAALLLARTGARERELAVRASLGAQRGRLVRQLLTESLCLGLGGAVLGSLFAWAGVSAISWLMPDRLPRMNDIRLDAPVLAFAVSVALISAVLFGIYPALQGTRSALNPMLHEGGRGATESRRRARAVMVAVQVALCTTLLAGAGLLLRSFLKLQHVDPGFRAEGLVQLWVNPVGPASRNVEAVDQLYKEILRRIRALPGVESASAAITMPNAIAFTDNFRIEGQSAAEVLQNPAVPLNWIDTDYFRTMGIPLKAGRWFDEHDTASTRPVAVISETLARRYFPGQDPLGKRISQSLNNGEFREIVGVVGDAKYSGLARDWEPVYYFPSSQMGLVRWRYVVIRGKGDLMQLARTATHEIQSLPGRTPVTRTMTVTKSMEDSIQEPRLRTLLIGLFATIALLLAAAGIYGVMAYSVSQRTREFGIRLALGARAADIWNAVVREAALITGAGSLVGVSAALLLTRSVERFLFQVESWDPLTYTSAISALMLAAIAASLLPAWKAMKVDPAITLRQD